MPLTTNTPGSSLRTRAIPGANQPPRTPSRAQATHVSPAPRGRWPVPRVPGAWVGHINFVLGGARNAAKKPCPRHRGAAIAPRPEVAWLGSPPRTRAGPPPGQWGGVQRRDAPRPGNHRLWGGHRAKGGGRTGSQSEDGTGQHGPPRSTNSQSKAGSRATRRHSNQFNLLPPPGPSTIEKKRRPRKHRSVPVTAQGPPSSGPEANGSGAD